MPKPPVVPFSLPYLLAATAALLWPAALAAHAVEVLQSPPDHTSDPLRVLVDVDIRNDSASSTYYASDLSLLQQLADTVWGLPQVRAAYATKSAMWNAWSIQIAVYEVDWGWRFTESGPDAPVAITHAEGFPGGTYDPWFATSVVAAQDELRLRVGIPKSQLDADGDGWALDDPGDYHLEVDPAQPVLFAVSATSGPGGEYSDNDALAYRAVPAEVASIPRPALHMQTALDGRPELVASGLVAGTVYHVQMQSKADPDSWLTVDTLAAEGAAASVPLGSPEGAGSACYRLCVP